MKSAALVQERARVPGLALAAEVKLPTARNTRIGTGKTDYNVSLLASKRTARWACGFMPREG